MVNLFKYELFSRGRAMLIWGVGLAAFGSMYVLVYPEFQDLMGGLAGMSIYQAMGIDMASFEGFIASVVLQILPILLGIYVITAGTGTLAGEEENGTLEMVVTMPIPRWQIVLTKTVAISLIILGMLTIAGLMTSLSLAFVKQSTQVAVTPVQLVLAMMSAWFLHLAVLTMSMALSAIVPARRWAVAIMAVIYIGSYVIKSIVELVPSLDFIKPFSLFTYLDATTSIFQEGINPVNIIVLLVLALVFVGITLVAFERRSITVGSWVWQKGRVGA
jgi:ABC-2 type transport system permease protein